MNNNYVAYHLHSDYSLLDSCTKFQDYIDKAVELGQKAICFTEHGKPLGWVAKKMYCDEKGIKYLHGVECYLTETLDDKIRDNYHTILIAKNYSGLLEINKIISTSCDKEHFYYVNRISFDEFLKLSDNIIKISACLASPLNKLDISHKKYIDLVKKYDYLEIQPHIAEDQKKYNIHLATLSYEYNKPLIAGTDTHSLNSYKAECRGVLLEAKRKSYGDEDSFDLTYKSYDEIVEAFKKQEAIPETLYLQAIENTNIMADSVEDFNFDKSPKYPILYGTREKDREIFRNTIKNKFEDKIKKNIIPKNQVKAFELALKEEQSVFSKINMDGFMLSMSELISWCKDNSIPVGNARGSVGGSRVAYITDIIDLNPETWHTVFSRFCNEDREEVGDIDVDVIESDRPKIFQYITNRFGIEKTARVPSYTTVVSKGTIDEICRAFMYKWNENHGLKFNDKSKDNPYSYNKVGKIKKEFSLDEEKTREKYPDIFYYYDGLTNTKIAQSVHPAGMVISPITLADNYGVFYKDDAVCLMIDMDEIHEVGLVKYDFLILGNIQIIRDTYELIGKPYPKSHEIDWDDQAVWKDMIKTPVGIFQMEGEYSHSLLRQFEPHSIFDMSLVTAAIRPSGASYRNELIKHIPYKNPSPLIDELLADNKGYLIYQEDTIKFLQQICGLSGSEADNVRRAIGRKDKDRLEKALPQILEGYCRKSTQTRKVAEQEAKTFLQIIEDSANYQFNYNHSIAYCLIGYICAYLRYYYPYEFITAYLNNAANDNDITNGTQLAQEYNIKISPPKYGLSKDEYVFNKEEKVIAKGISSIKFLNKKASVGLYELSQEVNIVNFLDILLETKKRKILNSGQLEILIKIDYFNQFGNAVELLKIKEMFDFLKQGSAERISKDKITDDLIPVISPYVDGNKKDGTAAKTYKITDITNLMIALESHIKSLNIQDFDYKEKIQNQLELLGYVDLTTNKVEDRTKLFITDIRPLNGQYSDEPWGYALFTQSIGTGKIGRLTVKSNLYKKNPIRKMDIIHINKNDINKNNRGYWDLYNYNIVS